MATVTPDLQLRLPSQFAATQHHCPLAGTKVYYLVTAVYGCERLAGNTLIMPPSHPIGKLLEFVVLGLICLIKELAWCSLWSETLYRIYLTMFS